MGCLFDLEFLLEERADEKYREFSSSLVPNCGTMLGVRLPQLRSLAKRLVQENEYSAISRRLLDSSIFEERMVCGMCLGYSAKTFSEIIPRLRRFIRRIDNWSICDSFCASLKIAGRSQNKLSDFILPYFDSKREFDVRFAYVMELMYLSSNRKYLSYAFKTFDRPVIDKFYARMGAAWALSKFCALYPREITDFMERCRLDHESFSMAVRKICDCRTLDLKTKVRVREIMRGRIPPGAKILKSAR